MKQIYIYIGNKYKTIDLKHKIERILLGLMYLFTILIIDISFNTFKRFLTLLHQSIICYERNKYQQWAKRIKKYTKYYFHKIIKEVNQKKKKKKQDVFLFVKLNLLKPFIHIHQHKRLCVKKSVVSFKLTVERSSNRIMVISSRKKKKTNFSKIIRKKKIKSYKRQI